MIPVQFCGKPGQPWPRWMFWKTGHKPHKYLAVVETWSTGDVLQLSYCLGHPE